MRRETSLGQTRNEEPLKRRVGFIPTQEKQREGVPPSVEDLRVVVVEELGVGGNVNSPRHTDQGRLPYTCSLHALKTRSGVLQGASGGTAGRERTTGWRSSP